MTRTATSRFVDSSCSTPSMSTMVVLRYTIKIVAAHGNGGCVSFIIHDHWMCKTWLFVMLQLRTRISWWVVAQRKKIKIPLFSASTGNWQWMWVIRWFRKLRINTPTSVPVKSHPWRSAQWPRTRRNKNAELDCNEFSLILRYKFNSNTFFDTWKPNIFDKIDSIPWIYAWIYAYLILDELQLLVVSLRRMKHSPPLLVSGIGQSFPVTQNV